MIGSIGLNITTPLYIFFVATVFGRGGYVDLHAELFFI